MKRIWRPIHYPPFLRGLYDVSPNDQDLIFYSKKEYEKEEDYFLYESQFNSSNLENQDYKQYVESNIYYKNKMQQRERESHFLPLSYETEIDQTFPDVMNEELYLTPVSHNDSKLASNMIGSPGKRVHKVLFPEENQLMRKAFSDFPDSSLINLNDLQQKTDSIIKFDDLHNLDRFQDFSSKQDTMDKRVQINKFKPLFCEKLIMPGVNYLIENTCDELSEPSVFHKASSPLESKSPDYSYYNRDCHQSRIFHVPESQFIDNSLFQNQTRNNLNNNHFNPSDHTKTVKTVKESSFMLNNQQASSCTSPAVAKSVKFVSKYFNMHPACSISRKLLEHQHIRDKVLEGTNCNPQCIEVPVLGKNLNENKEKKHDRKESNNVKNQTRTENRNKNHQRPGDNEACSESKKPKRDFSLSNGISDKIPNEVSNQILYDMRYIDVCRLSEEERCSLHTCLIQAEDISFTLMYNNGTTLISNGHQQQENNKKKSSRSTSKTLDKWVKSMAVSMNGCLSPLYRDQLLIFSFQTDDEKYFTWLRNMLLSLLADKQLIAFDAQKIIVSLIEIFSLQDIEKKETEKWVIHDPLLGTWLLNADKSPKTFQDVLNVANITPINDQNIGRETSWYVKATLLQMISAMKKINQLLKQQNMHKLFVCVETKLIPILACMETAKLKIQMDTVAKFSDVLKKKISKLETKAFQSVGHSFLINSHPQLRQVLYEELQLDRKLPADVKMVKTSVAHQKSTSESMLSQLSSYHQLPNIILEYRQLQKLKSTYIDGMFSYINKGYLSTHWDQIAAATGRLSSYHPNIQAIPKTSVSLANYKDNYIEGKTDESKMDIFAREPFISNDDWAIVAADFQQIELRLLAHLSEDQQLLDIFNNPDDKDIFVTLTSQWLMKPYDKITQIEREQTKRIVYSVMYGVGKDRLSDYLKVTPDNAKAIMNSFLIKFPAVNRFTKTCIEYCKRHGFTSTLFGRRRYIPNITSLNPVLRAQAERQCFNFCVQGSAADLCKAAMIKVESVLQKYNSRLLVQIHDELVWEVPESQISVVTDIIKCVMEDRVELCRDITTLKVPIAVTMSTGKSWAHLTTIH